MGRPPAASEPFAPLQRAACSSAATAAASEPASQRAVGGCWWWCGPLARTHASTVRRTRHTHGDWGVAAAAAGQTGEGRDRARQRDSEQRRTSARIDRPDAGSARALPPSLPRADSRVAASPHPHGQGGLGGMGGRSSEGADRSVGSTGRPAKKSLWLRAGSCRRRARLKDANPTALALPLVYLTNLVGPPTARRPPSDRHRDATSGPPAAAARAHRPAAIILPLFCLLACLPASLPASLHPSPSPCTRSPALAHARTHTYTC